MSEWRECKLGAIATKIGSGATPTGGSNQPLTQMQIKDLIEEGRE